MHIKRYQAATLEEALAQVREELGPDALVLSTRQVRREGALFGWLGRSLVEVVAAVDREVRRGTAAEKPPRHPADESWRSLSLTQALLDPIESEIRGLRRVVEGLARGGADVGVREELEELRRSLAMLVGRGVPESDPLVERLVAVGWAVRHARELANAARSAAGTGDPCAALARVLEHRLDARLPPPRDDGPGEVVLFVGSGGVGKTTTVAKLAGRRPGSPSDLAILSTDVHRAGGFEPLRALAAAQRIAFATATSPDDAALRVQKLRARRILIDTCGRDRGDAAGLAELVRLRTACGERARVHLVLAATTKEEDLRAELRRFSVLAPDALVVTRTDDTENLASVANLLLDDDTPPLSWLGVGRRVPEDLALPDPRVLAQRMLGVAA